MAISVPSSYHLTCCPHRLFSQSANGQGHHPLLLLVFSRNHGKPVSLVLCHWLEQQQQQPPSYLTHGQLTYSFISVEVPLARILVMWRFFRTHPILQKHPTLYHYWHILYTMRVSRSLNIAHWTPYELCIRMKRDGVPMEKRCHGNK